MMERAKHLRLQDCGLFGLSAQPQDPMIAFSFSSDGSLFLLVKHLSWEEMDLGFIVLLADDGILERTDDETKTAAGRY